MSALSPQVKHVKSPAKFRRAASALGRFLRDCVFNEPHQYQSGLHVRACNSSGLIQSGTFVAANNTSVIQEGIFPSVFLNFAHESQTGLFVSGLANHCNGGVCTEGGYILQNGRQKGVFISGLINATDYQKGIFLAGAGNITEELIGVTISFMNVIGKRVKGVLVGVAMAAHNVVGCFKGVVVGLVNIVHHSKESKGVMIGAINIRLDEVWYKKVTPLLAVCGLKTHKEDEKSLSKE
ncbi:hypothetical protein HZC07_04745 [Candidatus Micrarchaeota archaeon]|nr:hypothetical protein [Candidatus Micrarchaeota archaeon]